MSVTLVTGFPTSFLAQRMVRKILASDRAAEVRCVVETRFLERAREVIASVKGRERVRLLEGDVTAMDLGLSGEEFVSLAAEVDVIHHCATETDLGVSREIAERVNVEGVREVIELAQEAAHLERLVHWSTALVSGGRRGYVLEDELTAPDGFRNAVEETRFRAEQLVRRAMQGSPPRRAVKTTILRPAIIVGDSVTGEIDRFEGPYLLVLLMLNAPLDLRVPLPGRGDVPLNLVPIDHVVDAGWTISSDPRSVGRTFHIVDPTPHSARRAFELIAQAAGRPLPRGFLPTNIATTLLKTPGVERFAQVPRAFLEQLATEVVYDDRGARELLEPKGIRCPGFGSYVDVMVQYVRQQQRDKRRSRPGRDGSDGDADQGQGPVA
jgi:thioester reductase-like protein